MKRTQILVLALILSASTFTMKTIDTSQVSEEGEQTSLLLKGANKVLSQKVPSEDKKIEEFAQSVFSKVNLKKEIFLPTPTPKTHIEKKMKFIEIDVNHNDAPNKESNEKNIKLLNLYH